METSNILEMLNSYFFGDGDVDVNELVSALLDSNQKDNKLRIKCINDCKKDFTSKVWSQLDEISKEHIIAGFISYKTALLGKFDLSRSIQSVVSAFEDELKSKIFNDFNLEIIDYIDSYKEPFDKPYVDQMKSGRVTAKMMISKFEHVSDYRPRGICGDLADYLKYDWDLYVLSNEDGLKKAYDLVDIRNDDSHDNTEFDGKKFIEAKTKTINVLSWFIGALK